MRILRVACDSRGRCTGLLDRHIDGCGAVGLRRPWRRRRARRDLHGPHANSTYTLDITFPNDYPDQQALTAYLTQARDGFVNVSEMPGSYNLPYELDAKGTGYRTDSPTGGTRSVVFTMWQNVGGAHPQTWYKSFNWDLGKKAPITFDTLFKPGTKPLDVIYPAVEQYIQKQQGLIDGIPPSVGLDPAKYQNFALTDDSLIFFFGQGELFAESAGPVEASVPRATLAPLLA